MYLAIQTCIELDFQKYAGGKECWVLRFTKYLILSCKVSTGMFLRNDKILYGSNHREKYAIIIVVLLLHIYSTQRLNKHICIYVYVREWRIKEFLELRKNILDVKYWTCPATYPVRQKLVALNIVQKILWNTKPCGFLMCFPVPIGINCISIMSCVAQQ